jgi:hypothetical protein
MKKILNSSIIFGFLALLFFAVTPTATFADCSSDRANLSAMSGPMSGEVTLNWSQSSDVSQFAFVYGVMAGDNRFGWVPVDKVLRSAVVKDLEPGKQYFFRVWSFCSNDGPAMTSNEVMATAGGGVTMNTSISKNTTNTTSNTKK